MFMLNIKLVFVGFCVRITHNEYIHIEVFATDKQLCTVFSHLDV